MKCNLPAAMLVSLPCVLILASSSAHAGYLGGAIYTPGGTLSAVSGAVADITGTPAATFNSTLVNNGTYSGSDNSSVSSFLNGFPTDQASISANPGPLGTFVMDLHGFVNVSTTGTYTFADNNDDGGAFFLGGNGTPGSGLELAEVDGDHGQNGLNVGAVGPVTATLVAGENYRLEYVYYNSSIGGSGGADAVADITGPGTVSVSLIATPEPSSIVALVGLCGMGLIGLIRYRRWANSRVAAIS
jgi:hypothetical protein